MNKSEFASFLASRHEFTQTEANKVVTAFVDSVQQALSQGESVNIIGFGSFSVVRREERSGRNPKTGQTMTIEAYNQPTFKAGKSLKEACNQ